MRARHTAEVGPVRLARRLLLLLGLCSNPALGHRSSASPVAKNIQTSKVNVDFGHAAWSVACPKTSPPGHGLETGCRSGSPAAAVGNLRIGARADQSQVVLALTAMTAPSAAARPGVRKVCRDLVHRCGRLGCLLSGDGTYGRPTSVPWAMTFPNGVVPTNVPVHPTPLYEALAAVLIAVVLWALGRRWNPAAVFGAYLALSGISRFLVEFLRINEPALLGLTQPQLWALVSGIVGVVLIVRAQYLNRPRRMAAEAPGLGEEVPTRLNDAVTAQSTR